MPYYPHLVALIITESCRQVPTINPEFGGKALFWIRILALQASLVMACITETIHYRKSPTIPNHRLQGSPKLWESSVNSLSMSADQAFPDPIRSVSLEGNPSLEGDLHSFMIMNDLLSKVSRHYKLRFRININLQNRNQKVFLIKG